MGFYRTWPQVWAWLCCLTIYHQEFGDKITALISFNATPMGGWPEMPLQTNATILARNRACWAYIL